MSTLNLPTEAEIDALPLSGLLTLLCDLADILATAVPVEVAG